MKIAYFEIMISKVVLVGIAVLCSSHCYAQKDPYRFGEIPAEDLQMTVYPEDSTAEAVVLFDFGTSHPIPDYDAINLDRHVRMKILKTGGLDQADVNLILFRFAGNEDRIQNLKASTFNLENGKLVETKMPKEAVFKTKINKNTSKFTFTLPQVRVGSIIEFTYTLSSGTAINFPSWHFQRTIPVRHSEYWVLMPRRGNYPYHLRGQITPVEALPVEQTMYGYWVKAHQWTADNVPALRREPYMPHSDGYMSQINFLRSSGPWFLYNQELLDLPEFGKAPEQATFLDPIVSSLVKDTPDTLKRVSLICDYVKKNFSWTEVEDIFPDPLKEVFDKKKGSSADLNMLLCAMLLKAGIQTEWVLLSTKDHGPVEKDFAVWSQLNYMICMARIKDRGYLLDATEKLLPFDVLPTRCLNGEGLIISRTDHGWVRIGSRAKSKTTITATFAMDEAGQLQGDLRYTYDGYEAYAIRKYLMKNDSVAFNKMMHEKKLWQVKSSQIQNSDDISKPVRYNNQITLADHSTTANDLIYFNPFVTDRMEQNPYLLEKREYPIEYPTAIDKSYSVQVTLPPGYAPEEIPKNMNLVLPNNAGRFLYNVNSLGNTISITSIFQINKTYFEPAEYLHLREFYGQVIAKQAEQIVLKKKP